MTKKIFFVALLTFIVVDLNAQSFLGWQMRDRYFSVQVGTGWTAYFGDLTNDHPISDGISHFNVGLEARLYSKVSVRAQYATYRIEGSDANAKYGTYNSQRNLAFRSVNKEWTIQGMYYFYKYNGIYHKRRTQEPYVAVGVGQTFYNPKAKYNGEWYELRDLHTEVGTYGKNTLIIPLAVGSKLTINEFVNLGIELGYRFSFSKHLDDISGNYATGHDDGSISALLSNRSTQLPIENESAAASMLPGKSRGNGKADSYMLINLSLEIFLPGDLFKENKGRKEKLFSK